MGGLLCGGLCGGGRVRSAVLHKRLKGYRATGEITDGKHVLWRHAVIRHLADAASRQPKMFCQRLLASALFF